MARRTNRREVLKNVKFIPLHHNIAGQGGHYPLPEKIFLLDTDGNFILDTDGNYLLAPEGAD